MPDCLFEKRDDGVAVITMNRPERMNAMSAEMRQLLVEHIATCEADPEIRCVLLTGAGRAFCSGADVGGIQERNQGLEAPDRGQLALIEERILALRMRQHRAVLRLHVMGKPTVAVINGPAIGVGFSYALACDLRLMGSEARVSTGFGKMALPGDGGGTYFLTKLVGSGVARELCFTAEMIEAARALQLGLVNRVHPEDSLMEEALAFCARLAAGPTLAYAKMKENLNFAWTASAQEALDFEASNMIFATLSRDHKEAFTAFLEKRPPIFTGT
jgi:2-(1,2-epoxy-1,2-dihydrophenyl)acetyl-CoA isomerase